MSRHHSTATSINSALNAVLALRNRRQRDCTGTFWIEGIRPFVQACDAGLDFELILHSSVLLKSNLADMLARKLVRRGIARVRLSPEQFRSVSSAARASGIAAIVRQRWTSLRVADPGRGLAWLAIEHLRSPGNLGTILRTAEATGAGGVIFLSGEIDPFDPAAVRAGMAGLFHLPLVRATHEEFAEWTERHSVNVVGLSPDGPVPWSDLPPLGRACILIGTERTGLSARARALCSITTSLPMPGRADSLNVAAATAVMLYELVRRKGAANRTGNQ